MLYGSPTAPLGQEPGAQPEVNPDQASIVDALTRIVQHSWSSAGSMHWHEVEVGRMEVRATDYHTAGEPFRIVTLPVPEIPGDTVADRRMHAMQSPELDRVRRFLCYEPRGHADMYGCYLVPPDDDGGDIGVLFWHQDGFSTACGHGTIALATWLVETGRADAAADGVTDLTFDVPSGRVVARVSCVAGQVRSVTFRNVDSFVLARSVPVETRKGTGYADLAYGGAVYASVGSRSAGLAVSPGHYQDLIAVGREIKWALDEAPEAQHPSDPRLPGVDGTIWYDDLDTGFVLR
jgi:proline racemase